MTATVAGIHLGPDTHANRPAASAVESGTLYSCSDHDLVYISDGSSWTTWATLGGGGASLGAWTNYTPTITATGGGFNIGTGSVTGRYKELDATTYIVRAAYVVGTGGAYNAGSGTYQFSLPSGLTAAGTLGCVGAFTILDAATRRYTGTALVSSGGTVIIGIVEYGSSDRSVQAALPLTWTTGDTMEMQVTVEVA